jgi:hypothetical protein
LRRAFLHIERYADRRCPLRDPSLAAVLVCGAKREAGGTLGTIHDHAGIGLLYGADADVEASPGGFRSSMGGWTDADAKPMRTGCIAQRSL